MAYNILFTSMYAVEKNEPIRYYCAKDGDKRFYTDAMLTAEATTEYILSTQHIDEIIILGRQMTFDSGDEIRVLGVEDGKSFYASDINELSTYSLYRYRISEFIDDINIEQQDLIELLDAEDREAAELFIKNFCNKTKESDEQVKFSRFFDRLAQSPPLQDALKRELMEAVPGASAAPDKYIRWIKNYLYMNMKDSFKIEILEGNENAKVRFVPTVVDENGRMPIDALLGLVNDIAAEHESVDIYIALNNDDMTDNFVLLSALDILDTMYGSSVTVRKVCTATDAHYKFAGMLRDDTEGYGMSALVTATRAFLKYGKVDLIVDYWENSLSKNPQVEKMIYAMRRIDTGLSLCSISDIIKGIDDLRDLFRGGFDLSDSDYYSRLFILMSEGIKKDYGRLVTEEEAGFIDLVKWAYRKSFYQQCLTLIEARATRDMAARGMYYSCDSEDDRQRVTDLFAREWSALKSYERWKMNDIDHYFVKNHTCFKHPSNTIENQRDNAKELLKCLDNTDPGIITGHTACDDRQALEDLMFAYLHIGYIRNETNHAGDTMAESSTLFPDEKDVSSKLVEIQESIEYFIQAYDKVLGLIGDKYPSVVCIRGEDVKNAGRRIEREHSGQSR